jgi:hypothetical protein
MKLQNYSRNRKSNRIQQPEVLDRKRFYTFPGMACNFFVCMSVDLGWTLQNFNMPKVLIEKPALAYFKWSEKITHCEGSQWAPGQGTEIGTAQLRDSCILKAAAARHHSNPDNCGTWIPGPWSSRYSLCLCSLHSTWQTCHHLTCSLFLSRSSQLAHCKSKTLLQCCKPDGL